MFNLKHYFKDGSLNEDKLSILVKSQEYKIFYLSVPGDKTLSAWEKFRASAKKTGFWPVIMGEKSSFEYMKNGLQHIQHSKEEAPKQSFFSRLFKKPQPAVQAERETPAEIIQNGELIDPDQWRSERQQSDPETYTAPRGDWPSEYKQKNTFYVIDEAVSANPVKDLYLALIPTTSSWQAPAYLYFGDWNFCPPCEVHTSILSKWQQAYGAEIVAVTSETIELSVSNPPKTREDALKLAEEQFIYCEDIVLQGTETLETLGAELLNSKTWFFWWD